MRPEGADWALGHARAFGYAGKVEDETKARQGFGRVRGLPDWHDDLSTAVLGPLGDVVAFAGLWFDGDNRLCVLEPVGTAEGHRRQGLARSAIRRSLRAAKGAGARTAWAGDDLPVYLDAGFTVSHHHQVWQAPRAGGS